MKAALLCPGRSIAHFDGHDGYGLVIGVNRAATLLRCDVWAAGDEPLVRTVREKVIGSPILFTTAGAAALLRDHGPAWRGKVQEFESLSCAVPDWNLFTATASLVLIAASGFRKVTVFGADFQGVEDFDGTLAGMNRSEDRWRVEAGLWRAIGQVLEIEIDRSRCGRSE